MIDEQSPGLAPGAETGSASTTEERPQKRILLVDENSDYLEHLDGELSRYSRQWQVESTTSAEQALAALQREPADVVVAAMQMRELDGATLLGRVRELNPTTVRMILSSDASAPNLTRAATVAHRFLGKSSGAHELVTMIERSLSLRKLTEQTEAYRATIATTTLPSRPALYTELNRVLADPLWGPDQVANVIERDIAMTAKVLQLANSAFFGVGHRITNVRDAVVYLGVETIRSLTLTAEAFGKLAPRDLEGFSIDEFQRHSMLVARITGAILPDGRAQQEAVTAALLHDVGKLVLIADGPERWIRLNDEARARNLPLHEVERELEGVTHADTGAYLLSLWGLPDSVVEAVAHHHDPDAFPGLAFDPVAAVHIADSLAHELSPPATDAPPPGTVDESLLDRLGLRPRQDLWRHMATQLAGAGIQSHAA
jgi:putative nucleotidyltransferase with HDIG domain